MRKLMLLSLGVVGALASIDGDADAATLAGAAGSSRLALERDCFQYEFGQVYNTNTITGTLCDGAAPYTIVTPTISGSRAFAATGCAESAATTCAVIIVGADGWHKSSSASKRLSICPFVQPSPVSLATLSVASTDSVLFECGIVQGSLTGVRNFVGSVTY